MCSTLSKRLSVLPPSPRFWHRYVDDTFVIQKEIHKKDFLQHNNSVDPAIQFTVEDNKEDGAIASWTPLLNQRLMGNCLPQCTGNLPTLTNTCSGTVTITSQPGSVLSTPFPTGPTQYAAILRFSTRRRPSQECTNTMQLLQMGFRQGGEKAQQTFK